MASPPKPAPTPSQGGCGGGSASFELPKGGAPTGQTPPAMQTSQGGPVAIQASQLASTVGGAAGGAAAGAAATATSAGGPADPVSKQLAGITEVLEKIMAQLSGTQGGGPAPIDPKGGPSQDGCDPGTPPPGAGTDPRFPPQGALPPGVTPPGTTTHTH